MGSTHTSEDEHPLIRAASLLSQKRSFLSDHRPLIVLAPELKVTQSRLQFGFPPNVVRLKNVRFRETTGGLLLAAFFVFRRLLKRSLVTVLSIPCTLDEF